VGLQDSDQPPTQEHDIHHDQADQEADVEEPSDNLRGAHGQDEDDESDQHDHGPG